MRSNNTKTDDKNPYLAEFELSCRTPTVDATAARAMVLFRSQGLCPAQCFVSATNGTCHPAAKTCQNTVHIVRQRPKWKWKTPVPLSSFVQKMTIAEHKAMTTTPRRWCAAGSTNQKTVQRLRAQYGHRVAVFRHHVMAHLPNVCGVHFFKWDGTPRTAAEMEWALCYYSTRTQHVRRTVLILVSAALGIALLGGVGRLVYTATHDSPKPEPKPQPKPEDRGIHDHQKAPASSWPVPKIKYYSEKELDQGVVTDLYSPYGNVVLKPQPQQQSTMYYTPMGRFRVGDRLVTSYTPARKLHHYNCHDKRPATVKTDSILGQLFTDNMAAYDNMESRLPPDYGGKWETKTDLQPLAFTHISFSAFHQELLCCMELCMQRLRKLTNIRVHLVVYCREKSLQNQHAWTSILAGSAFANEIHDVHFTTQASFFSQRIDADLNCPQQHHYLSVHDTLFTSLDMISRMKLALIAKGVTRDINSYFHVICPYVSPRLWPWKRAEEEVCSSNEHVMRGRQTVLDTFGPYVRHGDGKDKQEVQEENKLGKSSNPPPLIPRPSAETDAYLALMFPSKVSTIQTIETSKRLSQIRSCMHLREHFNVYATTIMDNVQIKKMNKTTFYFDHSMPFHADSTAAEHLPTWWTPRYKTHHWNLRKPIDWNATNQSPNF